MNEPKSFEQKQAELEAIVQRLESGNAPLEEMIALYEQVEALYRECAETLDAYEARLKSFEKEKAE